jgi:hypothetical protein
MRREGEAYREKLKARARELGLADRVVFLDQFVDPAMLVDFISIFTHMILATRKLE